MRLNLRRFISLNLGQHFHFLAFLCRKSNMRQKLSSCWTGIDWKMGKRAPWPPCTILLNQTYSDYLMMPPCKVSWHKNAFQKVLFSAFVEPNHLYYLLQVHGCSHDVKVVLPHTRTDNAITRWQTVRTNSWQIRRLVVHKATRNISLSHLRSTSFTPLLHSNPIETFYYAIWNEKSRCYFTG